MLNDLRCLPVVEIALGLPDKGIIKAKAIIAGKETKMSYYIFRTETN